MRLRAAVDAAESIAAPTIAQRAFLPFSARVAATQ
jgi:hypothetical protein